MQRSQTLPDAFLQENFHNEAFGPPLEVGGENDGRTQPLSQREHQLQQQQQSEAIVRNIASFLTVSDAASLISLEHQSPLSTGIPHCDSWAVGIDVDASLSSPVQSSERLDSTSSWEQQLVAPQTPAYISISPGATPRFDYSGHNYPHSVEGDGMQLIDSREDCIDEEAMEELLYERRRKWVQQRLAAAVYSHPGSVRSFCLQAHQSAKDILKERSLRRVQEGGDVEDPETSVEPLGLQKMYAFTPYQRSRRRKRKLLGIITDLILKNVPMSVLMDVLETVGEVSLDTAFASFTVTGRSMDAMVHTILDVLGMIWHGITNFNPFQLLEAIVSFQFNAMGKTSEVLASGIQSVATGMGSASSLALHRLSAANLSGAAKMSAGSASSNVRGEISGLRRSRSTPGTVLNDKLLNKLSTMNDAARVVRYMESEDETGGLTRQARSKVQRMMHYEVSLRPFVATVQGPSGPTKRRNRGPGMSPVNSPSSPTTANLHDLRHEQEIGDSISPRTECTADHSEGSSSGNQNSPLIYTPQSFPATPHSRQIVMARGGRFADDVVFLARDRLRLHDSLESENERTREMAKLLREGKRLAVFNARDATNGIELTCGQHIATKAGNMLYCTARSMVPVLRNCLVYFEITVLPRSFGNMALQPSMTTLSIGLSTEEMPANALVGAWQGSCGLCTTGQIFAGGEWCAPSDPTVAAYRDGATIGCLIYLDDESAVDTWEGILVNATITFNVNGFLVAPVVSSSIGVAAGSPSGAPPPPGMGMPLETGLPLPPLVLPPPVSSAASSPHPGGTGGRTGVTPPSPTGSCKADRPSVTLSIKVPASEELYPTVTLHSPATSVMSRFSAEDIVASSRETIGAPEGSTVYAVDGSVIFM